jgi:hypothetical protein
MHSFGKIYQKIAILDVIAIPYFYNNNVKDGISMQEVTKEQKHITEDGFGRKLRKKAVAASLSICCSGFMVLALLPTIYGSDWPERGWC